MVVVALQGIGSDREAETVVNAKGESAGNAASSMRENVENGCMVAS